MSDQSSLSEVAESEESSLLEPLETSLSKIEDVYIKLVDQPSSQLELCQEVGKTLRCIVKHYCQVLSNIAMSDSTSDDGEDYEEEDDYSNDE
jgi:hypothetical protein